MMRVKKIIQKIRSIADVFNRFVKRYQIAKTSSSISFYMIISFISIITIAIQALAYSTEFLNNFVVPQILLIFSKDFQEELLSILPSFSLNTFSILILINLLWSSSRTIHSINRVTDYIYHEVKPRTGIKYRINAFFMFSMLILVIIFEISLVILGNYFINEVIKINIRFLLKMIQIFFELFVLFAIVLVIYLYAPPKKTRIKDAYKGAFLATVLIYITLSVFLIGVRLLDRLGIGYTIITILSYSLIVIFVCNFILISGLIYNYYGNIFQLKNSLFSKK